MRAAGIERRAGERYPAPVPRRRAEPHQPGAGGRAATGAGQGGGGRASGRADAAAEHCPRDRSRGGLAHGAGAAQASYRRQSPHCPGAGAARRAGPPRERERQPAGALQVARRAAAGFWPAYCQPGRAGDLPGSPAQPSGGARRSAGGGEPAPRQPRTSGRPARPRYHRADQAGAALAQVVREARTAARAERSTPRYRRGALGRYADSARQGAGVRAGEQPHPGPEAGPGAANSQPAAGGR
ncbi:hypothetical protein D3C84_422890 [compost metagenome]